jgi:hypothetical protein
MSEKLSEAARLYLDDFDVLNEAHVEVLSLFSAVWKTCVSEINGEPGEDYSLRPRDWEGRKLSGQWSTDKTSSWAGKVFLYFQNQNGLYAFAADPARNGCERKSFLVGVEATRGWIAQMMSRDGTGKKSVDDAAKALGIQVNWDDNKCFMRAPAIAISIENPEQTGREVAGKLYEMLRYVDVLSQAVEKVGVSSPTDAAPPSEERENA